MERRKIDALIEETLHERSEKVFLPEAKKIQIYQAVENCRKEEFRMRWSRKRTVIMAVAAMCLMGSTVALAAGKIVGYSGGHSVDNPEFAAYAEMNRAEEMTGFPVKAVEGFDNGYTFESGYVIDVNAEDENWQVVDTFKKLSVVYGKDEREVFLNVEKKRPEYEESTTGNPVKVSYGDVTMTYREDHYKFVPPDYTLTEEDQRAMDSGELYVSYGSSAVEYTDFHFLSWEEDGISYLLMSSGSGALMKDELVKMGQQIIDSPKL